MTFAAPVWAQTSAPPPPGAASDPAIEARVQRISNELRCLVCQNQTIADSNAGLAVDLRQQVREMLLRGQSERQIIDFMTERYGDFVLYRPPVNPSTAVLWFGPAALLLLAAGTLIFVLRRRSRLPADRFEPDPQDERSDARTNPLAPTTPPPSP